MKRLLLACIAGVVLYANASISPIVSACGVGRGDSWYVVDSKIIDNPLSKVLNISVSENAQFITFTNLGLTSNLYIGSKDTDGKYPGYDKSRQDYRPKEEIFGKEFEPNVLVSAGDGMPKGVYGFHGGWGESINRDTTTPETGTLSLASVLDTTDNYKNMQKYGDNRPDDAAIPDPDHQTMYAFYEGNIYEIPIVLSYSLKKNYISDMIANSCAGEGEAFARFAKERETRSRREKLMVAAPTSILLIAVILLSIKPRRIKSS